MIKLPVIVGMGGMNAAGRTSGFHAYKRMVCDVLSQQELVNTWRDLAHRMALPMDSGLSPLLINMIKQGTLVRRIEHFDIDRVNCHHKARLDATLEQPMSFIIKKI